MFQVTNKRRRTSEDFLAFCRIILDYENYDGVCSKNSSEESDPRRRHRSSSPLGSVGSNESLNSKDEDEDEITCYCKKPFAGRPMIECSSCLTWIHLSCAKIKRTNIPDTWNCSKCVQRLSSPSQPVNKDNNNHRSSRKRKTSPLNSTL